MGWRAKHGSQRAASPVVVTIFVAMTVNTGPALSQGNRLNEGGSFRRDEKFDS